MQRRHEIRTGNPFTGADLKLLKQFLKEQGLDYDEAVNFTVMMMDENRIIATGSCDHNIIKCVAVSPDYQGQNLMGRIIEELTSYLFANGITHYFGFTKPKNREIFGSLGLYPVAGTENVLLMENRRDGLKKYIHTLQKEKFVRQKENGPNLLGEGIGAIVANCNPFTLGHAFLIEKAAAECRWLHVFILSENQPWLTSADRYEMVRKGTSGLPNVILHKTSDYLISPVVFPTYFMKEKQQALTMNCMLDIEIFKTYIAKSLMITKRYVGTEETCQVTAAYNECLKMYLPQADIEVVEYPRMTIAGKAVSASEVRKALDEGRTADVERLLPKTSYDYLMSVKHVVK